MKKPEKEDYGWVEPKGFEDLADPFCYGWCDEHGEEEYYQALKEWESKISIVRNNLMTVKCYTPYCGNNISRRLINGCSNPRTKFNGQQFCCPKCSFVTSFPIDFIGKYKEHWGI